MLGGRPLQQMEADHGMLCGRLILRTHKQQNPSRRSEGFSFVGPDTAKSTDAFCAMSLLFLQLGHGAQRRDWLADEAVNCEPVSASKFLLTGKLTGNFAEIQPSNRDLRVLINARIQ